MDESQEISRDYIDRICQEAMEHFGFEVQLNQLQEECGELVAAVNHLRRRRSEAHARLVSELADVIIMTRQVRHALGASEIDSAIKFKLQRLELKIQQEKRAHDERVLGGV